MKAVLHYDASPGFSLALALAGEAAGVATAVTPAADAAAFARAVADAEVLLHVITPVTPAMMDAAPGLRLIQKIGVGLNTIDLEAARARGIAVCNMPGRNSQAVAEFTLGLMLAVLRRIAVLDWRTRACEGWSLDPAVYDTMGEIGGRTVGFVGFGSVPSRLAPALEALGARVLYTATGLKPGREASFRSFDTLLEEVDILSLHAPLTTQTRGLIAAAALARLRPGAVLVNTARGGLVDEAALADALRSGRLSGAGLDVFAQEPVVGRHPLAEFEGVVMTPHAAWNTPETLTRSLSVAFDNVERLERGDSLLNRAV